MAQFAAEDFEERYLLDMIDPLDSTYMLSELMATITNKFNEAMAIMTKTPLKEKDLTNGEPFLPKFATEKPLEKMDDDSLQRHKRAAAAAFG